MDKTDTQKNAFIFAILFFTAYFVFNFIFLFVPTAPSDPLQYVGPAILTENSFAFLDRIVLWLWMRFFVQLPIPAYMVGGVATLFQTSLILGIGTWWLIRQYGLWSGIFFGSLFSVSLMGLFISTYTYPMQLMTLVLLITIISMDMSKPFWRYLVAGFGYGIALFCKIQAFSFGGFLLISILLQEKDIKGKIFDMFKVSVGVLFAILGIALILAVLDGHHSVLKLIETFFGTDGNSSTQFKGRGEGGMPPIYEFLKDPTCLMAFIGFFLPFILKVKNTVRDFALVGFIQTSGLVAIYLITQRGGPLIHNYSYDSFVFGLLAFSAVLGVFFGKSTLKTLLDKSSSSLPFYFILFIFLTLVGISFAAKGDVEFILKKKYYYVSIFFICFFVAFAFPMRKFFKENLALKTRSFWFIAMALMWWCFSYEIKGENMVVDKIQFSEPYHKLSKEIVNLGPDVKIWARAKVNRHEISDGTERLKLILQFLYLKHDLALEKNRLYFDAKQSEGVDVIMTDSPEIIETIMGLKIELPSNSVVIFKTTDKSYRIVNY